MAYRFRRTLTIVPGVRLNFGKRGVSLSAGPRGATLTLGRNGVYANAGLPGSGLSLRQRLDGASGSSGRSARGWDYRQPVFLRFSEDLEVIFVTGDGNPVPPAVSRALRAENAEKIQQMLESGAQVVNSNADACLSLHQQAPAVVPGRVALQFDLEMPQAPAPYSPSFVDQTFGRLTGRYAKRRAEADAAFEDYKQQLIDWKKAHSEFTTMVARAVTLDIEAMSLVMQEALSRIDWPRETHVAFDFGDDARSLALDIDLPDLEGMPRQLAVVPARGLKLSLKQKSDRQLRLDFSTMAFGTVYRIVGEAFAHLPAVVDVVVSAYVQRINPATGREEDVFVISVRVPREGWQQIEHGRADSIDPELALGQFHLVTRKDRTGFLQPIKPLPP